MNQPKASHTDLRQQLLRLDRQNYGAYKQLRGSYQFPGFTLTIDHVQGDPFAAPSRVRALVPQYNQYNKDGAQFPSETFSTRSRAIALRDYLTRQFYQTANTVQDQRGSGKSGLISMVRPGQQILERSAVAVTETYVEARFVVGLPAQGRSILGRQAAEMLCDDIPAIVERSLFYRSLNSKALRHHLEVAEDVDWLRHQLSDRGLIAFVANGSILPRRSGVDDRPLSMDAIPFQSPDTLEICFDCPNAGKIRGMGISRGITLIVGGGYHGKSTLLNAIAQGVYTHIPGDGREYVVTDPTAFKVRSEDGRSVVGVDISPFINHLPQGRSTTQFSTENASGSTSQSASIIEALEVGVTTLLVDEDTSATNFMIRDRRMQALISKDKEPITPFIDKIEQLYREHHVSTLLVMGGSGDYFDVATTVIAMTQYQPEEVTQSAKAIAQQYVTHRAPEGGVTFGPLTPRIIRQLYSSDSDRRTKLKARDMDELVIGNNPLDLSAVEQLVELTQVRTIGAAIAYLNQNALPKNVSDLVHHLCQHIAQQGLEELTSEPTGDLAMIRPMDLAAAINRLRSLKLQAPTPMNRK